MSSTETLFILFLTTGFTVGFGHCIGMCGPIVVSLSLNLQGRSIYLPHLLYNLGRTLTYTLLGAAMGLTGAFARVTAGIAGIQKGALIFAGALIIVMGLAMSGWVPVGRIFKDDYNPDGAVARGFRKLTALRSAAAYLPLGLLLGLLPCGPVYTALIAAARAGMEAATPTQGVVNGGVLMFAFGLGTVPALFLVAKLADLGWLKWRHLIYKISSVLMIAVGVYFVIKGIRY
jgi:sulfite exporter TauE/SafE